MSAFLALLAIRGLPVGSIDLQAGSYSSPCLLSVVYLRIASIFKLVHIPCQPLATCGLPADSINLPVVHLILRVSAPRILVKIRITWTHNVTLQCEEVEEGMELADLKWRIFLATRLLPVVYLQIIVVFTCGWHPYFKSYSLPPLPNGDGYFVLLV